MQNWIYGLFFAIVLHTVVVDGAQANNVIDTKTNRQPPWEQYWQAANKTGNNNFAKERFYLNALKAAANSNEKNAGAAFSSTLGHLKNFYQDQRFFSAARETDAQLTESYQFASTDNGKQTFYNNVIASHENDFKAWESWLTSPNGVSWRTNVMLAGTASNHLDSEHHYQLALQAIITYKSWQPNAMLRASQHTVSAVAPYSKQAKVILKSLDTLNTNVTQLKSKLLEVDRDLKSSLVCPLCESTKNTIPIIYGIPAKGNAKKQGTDYVLGGRMMNPDSPHHYCNVCDHKW